MKVLSDVLTGTDFGPWVRIATRKNVKSWREFQRNFGMIISMSQADAGH
jgi:hypothetical protein